MDFSTGTHLMTTATVFGAAALAFSIMPFAIVVLKSIFKAKESISGGLSILGVFFTAFGAHAFFCLMFMTIIKVLDITYLDEAHFFSGKIYQIFWAESEAQVFSLVGGGKTMDALGAYASLSLVQTIGRMILFSMPLLTFILGVSYGVFQGMKDTYKKDYLSIVGFTVISTICSVLLYIAWAKIASFALFLPDGKDLLQMIVKIWQRQLLS